MKAQRKRVAKGGRAAASNSASQSSGIMASTFDWQGARCSFNLPISYQQPDTSAIVLLTVSSIRMGGGQAGSSLSPGSLHALSMPAAGTDALCRGDEKFALDAAVRPGNVITNAC